VHGQALCSIYYHCAEASMFSSNKAASNSAVMCKEYNCSNSCMQEVASCGIAISDHSKPCCQAREQRCTSYCPEERKYIYLENTRYCLILYLNDAFRKYLEKLKVRVEDTYSKKLFCGILLLIATKCMQFSSPTSQTTYVCILKFAAVNNCTAHQKTVIE